MAKKTATTIDQRTPRCNDRELDCGLAAMSELYALLLACKRNDGARTCHVFKADDARIEIMRRACKYEGFSFDPETRGEDVAVSVSRNNG